ncbi:MAG: hypothetical protein AAB386_03440 [Patescibacteria group bacterium]
MIPLSIFLLAWLILLLIWMFFAIISSTQMLRFAVSGPMAYYATGFFMMISVIILAATIFYLLTADWSLVLNIGIFQLTPDVSF